MSSWSFVRFTTVYGLWFFPCLFVSKIIFYWIVKKGLKRAVFIGAAVTAACAGIHYFSGIVSIISLIPMTVFFLLAGYLWKQYEGRVNKKIVLALCVMIYVIALILNNIMTGHKSDYSSLTLGIVPLFLLTSLSGTGLITSLGMALDKQKILNDIGRDSMYFYGLHYPVLSAFRQVFHERYALIAAAGTLIVLYFINYARRWIVGKWKNRGSKT